MSKQGRNRDRRQKGGPKRRRGGPKWEDKKVKSRSRKRKDERQTNTVWRRGTYKKDMGEMIGGSYLQMAAPGAP